jgi:hypothetical protein
MIAGQRFSTVCITRLELIVWAQLACSRQLGRARRGWQCHAGLQGSDFSRSAAPIRVWLRCFTSLFEYLFLGYILGSFDLYIFYVPYHCLNV